MRKECKIKSNIYRWQVAHVITNKTKIYDNVIGDFTTNRTSI